MPGHLLVTPHRHVQKLSQLTIPELESMFSLAIKFQELIIKYFAPGCDISQHYRPFIKGNPVAVPGHLHIHVRPRMLDDKLWRDSQQHEKFEPVTDQEMMNIKTTLIG